MPNSPLLQKYFTQIDDLLSRYEAASAMEAASPSGGGLTKEHRQIENSAVSLLDAVLPPTSSHRKLLAKSQHALFLIGPTLLLPLLRSVREDLERGMFLHLSDQIESAIAVNYLEQAEQLLGEAGAAAHGYVPAAVLAGAVLERHLRELCAKQTPPVDTTKTNRAGDKENKTLDPLITDLVKAGAITSAKGAVLRGWAAIRNKAAHGEWDQFSRADVTTRVPGVTQFIAGF